jgi:hypothetical protein
MTTSSTTAQAASNGDDTTMIGTDVPAQRVHVVDRLRPGDALLPLLRAGLTGTVPRRTVMTPSIRTLSTAVDRGRFRWSLDEQRRAKAMVGALAAAPAGRGTARCRIGLERHRRPGLCQPVGGPLYPDTVTALMTRLINRHNKALTPRPSRCRTPGCMICATCTRPHCCLRESPSTWSPRALAMPIQP